MMKDAPIVRLTRAQIGKAAGLDTTVKSAEGQARAFAPTWTMVMGLKRQTLSEAEYTTQYLQILERVPVETWRWLWEQGLPNVPHELTVLCYCREGWFCHTHLLIDYACAKWPRAFRDGRAPSAP